MANARRKTVKTIAVGAFKSRSMAIINEIANGRVSRVVLTRRGKPVVAIVPAVPGPIRDLWGAMRGSVRIAAEVDVTAPTGEIWDAEREQ